MKRANRILFTLLLALAVAAASAVGLTALAAEPDEIVAEGYCGGVGDGENLAWTLTGDGLLTIAGDGPTRDYTSADETPYAAYRDQILRVTVCEGVTRVGDHALAALDAMTVASLPRSLRSIGEYVIDGCVSLEQIFYAGYEYELEYVTLPEELGDLGDINPYEIVIPVIPTGEEPMEWMFSEDGVLTVCGTVIPSYANPADAPWAEIADQVREIVLSDGMVRVGSNAFVGCFHTERISLPLSLRIAEDNAMIYSAEGPEIAFGGTEEQFALWLRNLETGYLGDFDIYALVRYADPVTIAYGTCGWTIHEETGEWTFREWELYEDGTLIIRGDGAIEDYPDGCNATPFFAYRDSISRVKILEGVTRMGSFALAGLDGLKTIELPLSLESVGEFALDGCTALEKIVYPGYRHELDNVVMPENIGDLGGKELIELLELLDSAPLNWWMEYGVLTITGTVIPNAENEDGDGLPWSALREEVEEVRVEEGVACIGDYAFANCPNLTTLYLPSTLRRVGDKIARMDRNLNAVYCAFDEEKADALSLLDRLGMVGLNRHAIPGERFYAEQIICLGDDVREFRYDNCKFIGGSDRTVLQYTYNNTADLTLPEAPVDDNGLAVETYEIGPFALRGGAWTESSVGRALHFDPYDFNSSGGDYLIRHHASDVESLTIPDSVSVIRPKAFMMTPALQAVSLPDGLTELGAMAFAHSGLKRVEIPDSVATLGDFTFYQSDLSEGVRLPEGIKELSFGMLMESGLTEIAFPASLEHTGEGTFYYCRQLTEVQMNNGLQTIDDWAFTNTAIASVDLPDTLVRIGMHAMSAMPLTGLVLPGSLERIGDYAFISCREMKTVQFPAGLKWIGSAAFDGCEKLESVDLPDGVNFGGTGICRSTVLTMEPNTWWGFQSVFAFCKSLKEIVLPESVTGIGVSMFWNCTALEKVVIKGDVKYIPEGAFFNCKALKEIFFYHPTLYLGVSWSDVTHCTPWDVNLVPEDKWYPVFSSGQYFCFNYTGDIYYNGTPEQWAEVRAPKEDLSGATVHFRETRSKAATCTEAGFTDAVMFTDSDYVIVPGQTVPAKGHAPVAYPATEATATEHGYTEGVYCPDCDTWLSGHEVIHNTLGEMTVLQRPTATEPGECIITCTVCGEHGLYAMEPMTPADPLAEPDDPPAQTDNSTIGRLRKAMKSIIEFFLRLLRWFGGNKKN